mmetsp:Transcript_96386/g.170400  ORF Transcript_96386/g.170400 Transcript_96386/m.170400 type:complete len:202 (+) Transcript_96386:1033-1638(+)
MTCLCQACRVRTVHAGTIKSQLPSPSVSPEAATLEVPSQAGLPTAAALAPASEPSARDCGLLPKAGDTRPVPTPSRQLVRGAPEAHCAGLGVVAAWLCCSPLHRLPITFEGTAASCAPTTGNSNSVMMRTLSGIFGMELARRESTASAAGQARDRSFEARQSPKNGGRLPIPLPPSLLSRRLLGGSKDAPPSSRKGSVQHK